MTARKLNVRAAGADFMFVVASNSRGCALILDGIATRSPNIAVPSIDLNAATYPNERKAVHAARRAVRRAVQTQAVYL